jgi:23S rRNA (uracil1939-C5)-methyltransferase
VTVSAPVEVTIDSLGARGDGIAEHGGRNLYVPFTVAGDRALVTPGEKRGEGVAAELVRIVAPGPGRATPPCRHFGQCGGCAVQHLDDTTYVGWKRGLLVDALARAGVDEAPVAPLVRIAPGTRRRASLGFVRTGKATVLGFAQRASHHLIDLEECPVLVPRLVALLAPLRAVLAGALPSSAFGDAIATLTETGIDLVIETKAELNLESRQILATFAEKQDLARLSWRKPGQASEPVAGRRAPVVRLAGVAVEPPPGAFLQPSIEGEATLAQLVGEAIDEFTKLDGRIADLFAGCGSLTLPLARTRRVHAVEGEAEPLAALARAANQAKRAVTTEARDLARRPLRDKELAPYAAIVFDPPRIGAAAQAQALAEAGPKLVVAVSCNPATMGRDARSLMDGGYRLVRATPVDQFLWSARLEAVAVFVRHG